MDFRFSLVFFSFLLQIPCILPKNLLYDVWRTEERGFRISDTTFVWKCTGVCNNETINVNSQLCAWMDLDLNVAFWVQLKYDSCLGVHCNFYVFIRFSNQVNTFSRIIMMSQLCHKWELLGVILDSVKVLVRIMQWVA